MPAIVLLGMIVSFIVLAAIWRGFILSVAWNWFFPAFFGLPDLTIPIAIAISTIMAFLTHQSTTALAKNLFPRHSEQSLEHRSSILCSSCLCCGSLNSSSNENKSSQGQKGVEALQESLGNP